MPKEHFAVLRATPLHELSKGARIHVIGVCGVAMAQLAIALSAEGYTVSGSDKEFYEPMAGLLRSSPVKLCSGYSASHLDAGIDLAVIGNAVSYGNPEADAVEALGLRYTFFPKVLSEFLISGRHSIVVSGTHGKTTTSAMAAYVLEKNGQDPSYFIGGSAKNLDSSLKQGKGKVCVVEGDEYDSAFFAKVPKFAFYRPDTLIVTSIEFDHADIYPSLEAIKSEFTKLVNGLPATASAICCIDDSNVAELLAQWKKSAKCRFITYGRHADAEYRLLASQQSGVTQRVKVAAGTQAELEFTLAVPGVHNATNSVAVLAACLGLNLPVAGVLQAFAGFSGVKRRQEILVDGEITLIEDFAHHPTAVAETIRAVRAAFGKRRLWAVFEPRSNTSRRKVFQEPYCRAFASADRVVLAQVAAKSIDAGQEPLDVAELAQRISASSVPAIALPDADAIAAHLASQLSQGDVILLMSNGSFGGLAQKLAQKFKS